MNWLVDSLWNDAKIPSIHYDNILWLVYLLLTYEQIINQKQAESLIFKHSQSGGFAPEMDWQLSRWQSHVDCQVRSES